MSRAFVTKTSFTAGELDPLLLGRLDLKAQEDGAAKLRNVVVHPTGGASRRPGLRLIAEIPGALRLVAFDGPDGGELVAFGPFRLDIIKHGVVIHSITDTLWGAAEIADLSATRWGDRLLLCHPGVPPKELIRNGLSGWALQDWAYETALQASGYRRAQWPFAKLARPEIALQIQGGTEQKIAANVFVAIVTSEPVFTADSIGSVIRVKGRDIRILNVDPLDRTHVNGVALDELKDGLPTRDWAEQAFSEAHGWPTCVAVHQERLVIGGSRDLPDRLWFSKTGHPFNFDPGTGLDDEAISFRLAGDEQHAIRGLIAGRLLQVFTSSGEWIVRGAPITPETVAVELQTRIGSWPTRRIDPVEVDGAALFIGASGRELREFLYAESEQAYQAADLALLSRHLLEDPVAMRFDRRRRWLLIARGDGQLATVAIDRNSNVVAWSLLTCIGRFRSIAVHDGEPHLLAELGGRVLLERFDETVMSDHAVTLARATPTSVWTGLGHLEGQDVWVQGDSTATRARVASGTVAVPAATTTVTIGTPYGHRVEPLPLAVPDGAGTSLDRPYRPVRIVFRLLATGGLRADTGAGVRPLALAASPGTALFTGDAAVRASGWRRGLRQPPWLVAQDDPDFCTILSVTSEIMGNT
jgi:hypothetical protein